MAQGALGAMARREGHVVAQRHQPAHDRVDQGQPKGFGCELALRYCLQELVDVAAWIDEGGFVRLVSPYEGAVLGEGGDGDGEAAEHGV